MSETDESTSGESPQGETRARWKRRVPWILTGMALLTLVYYMGFFGTYWREEVVLHDGTTLIATRWATRGGRHEIGQAPPIKAMTLSFTHPDTGKRITWKSEATPDVGLANFQPIALDVVDGTPYIITFPVGCLAYNKWDRPDPPYIIFRFDGADWRRIGIEQLPPPIQKPNLIISSPDRTARKRAGKDFPFYLVRAENIAKVNSSLKQLEYQAIVREPLGRGCEKKVWLPNRGSWVGEKRFTSNNNLEECRATCSYWKINEQDCPCKKFFSEE